MKKLLLAMLLAGASFAHADTAYYDTEEDAILAENEEKLDEINDKLDEINDKLDQLNHVRKPHYKLPKMRPPKEIGYVDKDGKTHLYGHEQTPVCTP